MKSFVIKGLLNKKNEKSPQFKHFIYLLTILVNVSKAFKKTHNKINPSFRTMVLHWKLFKKSLNP